MPVGRLNLGRLEGGINTKARYNVGQRKAIPESGKFCKGTLEGCLAGNLSAYRCRIFFCNGCIKIIYDCTQR